VVIQKALSADHDVELAETSRRGHAARLARGAANGGAEVVVALGGDGTLNETANGLVGTDTALATLPGGSTNVFARTLGLPNDPIEATGVLLESLAAESIRSVGLGSANGRYFLFHVGLGFDAAVVEQVERRGTLKRWAGHPLFLYAAIDTWIRHYDRSRPRFSVTFSTADGEPGEVIDDAYFGICMNTDPYTFLGNRPLHLAPMATLDSGLSMVTLRTLRLTSLMRAGGTALVRGGGLTSGRHIDVRHDLDEMVIRSLSGPLPHQVDGDFLGSVDELRIRHEPDALRMVLPVV